MKSIQIYKLILEKDYQGIEKVLSGHPELANEGLPYDHVNTIKAHPLHRICDAVFSKKYSDEEGVQLAKIFLKYGAKIDGNSLIEKQDTPLIAAASLHADRVAFLYIDHGAVLNHAGCHGGTALHWAAWCGRPVVVRRLIDAGAEINSRCIDFKSTPLFWAIHGLKNGGTNSQIESVECVKALLQSGADKTIPNGDGKTVFDLLDEDDLELRAVLNADH